MRDHNDNASRGMNDHTAWESLTPGEQNVWEKDASSRPHLYGLAPTAPVEASGSERDTVAKALGKRRGHPDPWPTDYHDADDVLAALQDLRPQPSGETREAVARLAWTYACSSDELDPQYDNGWSRALDLYANEPRYTDSAKEFVDRTWAFADAIFALLSARPLASGGPQGGGLESVSPEGLRARANMVRDVLNDGGSCARHLELAAAEIERLSTTPARAEAQDEGAAGEPRLDVLASMRDHYQFALSGPWPGVKTPHYAVAGLFKMAGDEIERLRSAHPSPTPAADDDRVRIACEKEAIAGALGNVLPLDIDWQHIRVASQAFVEALAALKSTAAKEGGE